MKAYTLPEYGPVSNLRLQEVPTPVPKGNQVLVRIHATTINDWDWSLVRGEPAYIRLLCGLTKPKIPIPGTELSGTIEALGPTAARFSIGDRVYADVSDCGFGAFAEYASIPETSLTPIPQGMSFAQAAAIPHAATLALQGLRDVGNLTPHHSLLINGAGGGVGTIGIQIARAIGVSKITGVDHSSKRELLLSQGFENTIAYDQTDFTALPETYDLILDTKTTRSPFHYLRALKSSGTYVTVGGTVTRLLQTALFAPFIHRFTKKRLKIVALKNNQDLDFINTLFTSGKLTPIIDGPHFFDQLPEALARFGEASHKGKLVIALP